MCKHHSNRSTLKQESKRISASRPKNHNPCCSIQQKSDVAWRSVEKNKIFSFSHQHLLSHDHTETRDDHPSYNKVVRRGRGNYLSAEK